MNIDSTSITQRNFEVNPGTTGLTLAFQDGVVGTDTRRSESKFKIRATNLSPGGQDLRLNRFWIQYANQQKPRPDFDGQFTFERLTTTNQINYLTQRYADSLLYSGAYFSEGGSETLQDWLHRGPYFHFDWPKDADTLSTRVNLNYSFSVAFENAITPRVILFDHWLSAIKITHKDGRVTDVEVLS